MLFTNVSAFDVAVFIDPMRALAMLNSALRCDSSFRCPGGGFRRRRGSPPP